MAPVFRVSKSFPTFQKHPHIPVIPCVTESEMHPGKEAGALHPEDGDEDVGDEDEEDEDGHGVVQAVQALLVALFSDVSPSCNEHTHVHTHTHTNYTMAFFPPNAAQRIYLYFLETFFKWTLNCTACMTNQHVSVLVC